MGRNFYGNQIIECPGEFFGGVVAGLIFTGGGSGIVSEFLEKADRNYRLIESSDYGVALVGVLMILAVNGFACFEMFHEYPPDWDHPNSYARRMVSGKSSAAGIFVAAFVVLLFHANT